METSYQKVPNDKHIIPHLLCVDLESWIFSKKINNQNLTIQQLRSLDNNYTVITLDFILALLKKNKQKITFFVVFKLEEVYPGIIEKILAEGHEVGWHTYSHVDIRNEEILEKELENSSKLLSKYKIKGFQAPQIVFFRDGYSLLKKYGFLYSSSIYGNSNIVYNFNGIYEIPVSTSNEKYIPKKNEISFPSNMKISNVFSYGIPFGSSFFWGILGERYYLRQIKKYQNQTKICNMFIHDWQLVTPTSLLYKIDVNPLSSLPFSLLFLPYRINVSHLFEAMISHFPFQRCIDYIHKKII